MNISLEKVVSLPMLIQSFRVNTKKQKDFIRTTLVKDINEIGNDGSLTEKDITKIYTYYGLAVPAFLGEGFCLLRGKAMSEVERYQLTYLGALTGLFDDFFDEKNTPNERILLLINSPNEVQPSNAHETLFIRFYQKALDGENALLIKEYFNKVYDAQVLSKEQLNPEIDWDTIKTITYQKGGVSILFYRSVFDNELTEPECELLFHLGALGQLENDIFDVYKDDQQKIKTLATTARTISILRAEYVLLLTEVISFLDKTHYSKKSKVQFLKFISLIAARGLVCLDVLEAASKKTHGNFIIDSYFRKDLICDMGAIHNQWSLFKYYVKKYIN